MNRRVLAAVDDIYFAAKIRGTAESLGVGYESARNANAAAQSARADLPCVVIADLHSTRCDPFALAAGFKSDPALAGVPLVGFFSHVQVELQQRALAAGFDQVFPRSAFVQRLAGILRGDA